MHNEGTAFMCGILLGAILMFLIFGTFTTNAMSDMQAHAIKCKAAEWRINQETGQTTFHWKDEP